MKFIAYHFVCVILLALVPQGRAKVGLTNSDDDHSTVNSEQRQCQEKCIQKVSPEFCYIFVKY